jgi:hypothetical protein
MSSVLTLTEQQARDWSLNTENRLAWQIASGLAGWMQLCCAKVIGQHVREDPARMALVDILQSQRGNLWLTINDVPSGWRKGNVNERVDVCLGTEKHSGSAGVIELKWPWTVADGDRISLRIDMIQDVARLASITTTEAPNIRYFVLGLMEQAIDPVLGKAHTRSEEREAQRIAFANLLSNDPADRIRTVPLADLESVFSELQSRTPNACILANCRIMTKLMAAEEISVGNCRLGYVYVWQCDTVLQDATSSIAKAETVSPAVPDMDCNPTA